MGNLDPVRTHPPSEQSWITHYRGLLPYSGSLWEMQKMRSRQCLPGAGYIPQGQLRLHTGVGTLWLVLWKCPKCLSLLLCFSKEYTVSSTGQSCECTDICTHSGVGSTEASSPCVSFLLFGPSVHSPVSHWGPPAFEFGILCRGVGMQFSW